MVGIRGSKAQWDSGKLGKHVVSEHGGMNIELGVMGHVAFMAHQLFFWVKTNFGGYTCFDIP